MLDVIGYVNAEKEKIKRQFALLTKAGHKPRMAIVTDNRNFDANASYIRSKTAFAMDVGVACDVIIMKENDEFPNIDAYNGVIVQYPFRDYDFNTFRYWVSCNVPPEKDIDGLTYQSHFDPCTPLGIVRYIKHLQDKEILNKSIVVNVIGYGGLVGEPLVKMLMNVPGYTVCVTRSTTSTWVADNFEASADVVVCATPKPNLKLWTNIHKVYIDCGCALIDGKLIGNVHRDCYEDEAMITPVPGGVGRLTVLSLFANLLDTIY